MKTYDEEVCNKWLIMRGAYDNYAKSVGMNYTSMFILYAIWHQEDCTQKVICQKTFLPKQTVHSVITGFYKDGLVKLVEIPEDRRNKKIVLTSKGKAFADKIIPTLDNAEERVFAEMSERDRQDFIRLLEHYATALAGEIEKEIKGK